MSLKNNTNNKKSEIAESEEKILNFWRNNKIFQKSVDRQSPNGEFVFYDGPPFATGLPHYGSLLSSIIKDVIPRYKTMRGYKVRRRWGWDCHGLPVESLIERNLGLKNKKDVEKLGVDKFNHSARKAVLNYADEWKVYIDRIGRFVDFDNSYKTMDNDYVESVWWALKEIYSKGLLYEGRKVLLYCTRCETPLAKAEIAMDNSYKDVTEESVIVKFKLRDGQKIKTKSIQDNTFVLAWTTTPWTLPGNVALAVGEDIDYVVVPQSVHGEGDNQHKESQEESQEESEENSEWYIFAEVMLDKIKKQGEYFFDKSRAIKVKGLDLVGLKYEPLFSIHKVDSQNKPKAHTILKADFVTVEEGTGVVHTAVIYGEDDYNLGLKEDLPIVPLLDASGMFQSDAPEFICGKFFKKAEQDIKKYLYEKRLIFSKSMHTHSYPHCYRCGSPLIYNALTSWFINIQSIKKRMLELNREINWKPEYLKNGRFHNILESAPDWTISRNRFWASPLPIWKNTQTGEVRVIGSIDEMKIFTKKSGNKYFVMRHGEAQNNERNIISSEPSNPHHLTERGRAQVMNVVDTLRAFDITHILTSPFIRTRETADIVAQGLGLSLSNIIEDERIREIKAGIFNGRDIDEYHSYFNSVAERFEKCAPEHGSKSENYKELKQRMGDFLYDMEGKYSNANILIITHDAPSWLLFSACAGHDIARSVSERNHDGFMQNAELRELKFVPIPHNEDYELDLHRPFIDNVLLEDRDGAELKRIPEVVDCWVESGCMPFAEYHYPFDNKQEFEKRSPGDFIAEYIAQTRTWFYYMHVISILLFDHISYRNVIATGTILAEDGSKMSKSKGNYTDPLINIDKFGADALRFYLITSSVMQGEDLRFSDGDLRDVYNRFINMLMNCYKFYDMYRIDSEESLLHSHSENEHILDQWILLRLKITQREVTEYLEEFDTLRAGRTMQSFVEDLSLWYIRRSRNRMRQKNSIDKKQAIDTLRYVLKNFSLLSAPLIPFVAEIIYRGVLGEKESVHLALWPFHEDTNNIEREQEKELLSNMTEVRRIVRLGLDAREKASIKVRQPLLKISIKSVNTRINTNKELMQLIKDELNIKNVEFDNTINHEVFLDTSLTEELLQEGNFRDLMRIVQDMRKKAHFEPSEKASLLYKGEKDACKFIQSVEHALKSSAGLTAIFQASNEEQMMEEFVIGGLKFSLSISCVDRSE